jgi:hypothetical protein
MRASKARVGRVALAAASTLFGLAAAELSVRALGLAPERWAQPAHLESEDKRTALDLYPDDPRDAFPVDLRDERVRARYRAALPEVDARYERTPHGIASVYTEELCRGRALPQDGPSVVTIGDSFTEGQGVAEEDTFSAVLAAQLGAHIVNCGRRGYDFPELRQRFDVALALEPEVVLYAMVLNDPERSASFHARQAYIDDWIVDRRRMVSEGDGAPSAWEPRIFALWTDRIEGMRVGAETERWYREMVGAENREGWAATLDHVEAMHETMRDRGGHLVVALWPLLVELDGEYPFEATHRTIVRGLRARGVRVEDTLAAFRGQDESALWVHPSDRHPNEDAHRIFAGAVAPSLRRALGSGS